MKALILAAGFGKRLQPITNTIPKSMVEVNGTPLLVNAFETMTNEFKGLTCSTIWVMKKLVIIENNKIIAIPNPFDSVYSLNLS